MPEPTYLVVEDNEDDVFALKWAFRKAAIGGALHVVTDGRQAVDYLAGVDGFSDRASFPLPDLVFLDLKLPYMSGHEILAWMNQREDLKKICVVILSGSDESRDHDQAAANGAMDYLVKPVHPDDLQRVVGYLPTR